jgi:hypothetical protein|tara:strand:- start:8252 stop:8572 length:321 start_codon:yes stop_codon:yes gene_type:complete
MEHIEKLADALNVEITDDYKLNATDMEISEWNTADSYEVFVITEDPKNLNWEYDVYYYEPSFDTIIERMKELPSGSTVYVSDYDKYLDETDVNDWLENFKELKNEN